MARRILYYDCFAGISGDMNLGALVDLGVPRDHLVTELEKLGLPGWSLVFEESSKRGIRGLLAKVELGAGGGSGKRFARARTQPNPIAPPGAAQAHEHRSYRDIVGIIAGSGLAEATKARSISIFRRIAEAEGRIHGQAPEDVGFHEVGALDSVIDIVGAAICLEWLRPDRILASRVEVGSGMVSCAHGLLPVPAPATALLLEGIPTKSVGVAFEATTPTGAAILAASVDTYTEDRRFTALRTGHGLGRKDGEVPNLLRVFLAEEEGPGGQALGPGDGEGAVLIECNVDDMDGEACGHLLDSLLAAGASDAWFTPIVMKKSRPGLAIAVLASCEKEATLRALLFRESTTFGLRRIPVGKEGLDREIRRVETGLGPVRIKLGLRQGSLVKWKPEYEDCHRLSLESGLSLAQVREKVARAVAADPECLGPEMLP